MSREQAPRVTFECPHCGEPVAANAKVCRACGASDACGWNDEHPGEQNYNDEDGFDYDEFVRREFPQHVNPEASVRHTWISAVIVLLVLSLILTMLF